MDLKDIKKLSCGDLAWLKGIESCGKLELPKVFHIYHNMPVSHLMNAFSLCNRYAYMLDNRDFISKNYHGVSGLKNISDCNSLLINGTIYMHMLNIINKKENKMKEEITATVCFTIDISIRVDKNESLDEKRTSILTSASENIDIYFQNGTIIKCSDPDLED